MMREINNKLDCCNSDNKRWCESAINLIPIYIREIKEKIINAKKTKLEAMQVNVALQ